MRLSETAFRYRPVVFMMLIVMMAYGVISYFTLPTREDPAITIREAVVTTTFPGLSPERMERLVTKTLEEAIRQVPEVEEIRSTTTAGLSTIHVEIYDIYFDLDQIWDEVREQLAAAEAELPDGASAPVLNDDFGDVSVVTATLTADGFTMGEMFDMAKHIRDMLYTVEGTRRIDILGAQEERIFIEAENARLAELGIGPDHLVATLSAQNMIRPGGEIDTGGRSFLIEPTGNFESVAEIEETLVSIPGTGDVVPLRDLAQVRRAYVDPPERRAYHNGVPAIVFAIAMLDDYSVLDFGPRVRTMLTEIERGLPVGYSLDIATFQADQVANAVFGVSRSVVQTLAIVLAVVILFLGVRTGLIVGSIVPAVMLVSLAVMGFMGMSLERMSLATLVISLGLLVDNAIVIAEDFKRRLEDGIDRDTALSQTGRGLAIPLLSSTLTTVLVFLPLMLAEHVAGEYARSISLVILIALMTSWILAMTVTPTLCHLFIKVSPRPASATAGSDGAAAPRGGLSQRLFDRMNRGYERLLRRLLRRRRAFLVLMVGLLAAAAGAIANAPQRFFPDSDRTQLQVYIDLPAGVSSRATDAALNRVFDAIGQPGRLPHVDSYAAYVGFGGPRFVLSLTPIDPAPHRAFMVVNVDGLENMDATIAELRAMFHMEFPELSARVNRMFLGPSDSSKIEVQIRGPDAAYIYRTADTIAALLTEIPGAIDVRHDWENRISRIVVDVDQAQARRAGVTSDDIARSMSGFFSGRVVSDFREGDDIFPIIARAAADQRSDLDRVRTLNVFAQGTGTTVPLMQVADIRLQNDFSTIAREDLVRTVTVESRNTVMTAEDMVPIVMPQLEDLRRQLPPGHTIELDGVVTQSAEGRAAMAASIPLCVGLILVLLVSQFNGFLRPLIIVATIPLLIIGAAVGLYALNANFGFMPLLGLYALAGIIINNAIVLIDRIDIERASFGHEPFEAMIRAAVRRLRPIIMSTVTTIIGLMPLIVSRDPLFYGLAGVIAGGLLIGTVLTLGVVPVLYSLIFGIRPGDRDATPSPEVSPANAHARASEQPA